MKRLRGVGAEMLFGNILSNNKFVSYWKGQKIQLKAIGKLYVVAVILNNVHTCLYGSTVSEYFDCRPPTVSEYLKCPDRGINISI